MIIILMGPPASGKGTQAELISDKYNIPNLSAGKIFRDEVEKESLLGLKVKSYIELGNLVPDELTVQMIGEKLGQLNLSQGIILDGFPRTIAQTKELERLLDGKNLSVTFVFYLDVLHETLLQRLSERGREDDQEKVIQNRLQLHEKQTKPLLDFYRYKKVLRTINGNQDVHEVFAEINQFLQGYLS